MQKNFFLVTFLLLLSFSSLSQSGPHMAASAMKKIMISADGKRMFTASYYDIAIWNLEDFTVMHTVKFEDLGIPISDDYYFASDPNLHLIWMKAFSKQWGALLDVDKWEYKKVSYTLNFISSDGVGFYNEGNIENNHLVDLTTGTHTLLKNFIGNNLDMNDAGDEIRVSIGKGKYKSYNFKTKKVETGKYSSSGGSATPQFSVTFDDRKHFKISPGGTNVPLLVGSNSIDWPRLVKIDYAHSRVAIFEPNESNADIHRAHVGFYSVPSGEVIKDVELNGAAEDADKFNKQAETEQKERQAAEQAARQQKLANAAPGYFTFASKFSNLTLPYTLNYDNAKGFSLAGDSFINSTMGLRAGSEIFGMGRICECVDHTSYLLLVKNQTPSTDLSTFIAITFDIDGTVLGQRTIGATQKDPSGTIRLDFTIPSGCLGNVSAKMTYPNGHVEDKSFSYLGCIFR